MQRMDLVERVGSGLTRINEMMDEYLLPHPTIEVSEAYFGITFIRPDLQEMSVEQRIEKYHRLGDRLSDSQAKILKFIKDNPNVSIPELAEKIKISTTAIEKNIKKLKDVGIIKRIGSAKSGYWEVIKCQVLEILN